MLFLVSCVGDFIGSKMIAEYFAYTIPTEVARLGVVVTRLGTGIVASVLEKQKELEQQSP